MKRLRALPLLPLGERIAVRQDDARAFGDGIDRLFPGLNAYDPAGEAFACKTAALKLPQLSLMAAALTPTHVHRNGNGHLALLLPISGQSRFWVGRHRWEWGQGVGGAFLPITDERNGGFGGLRSQLMLQLDRSVLQRTALAMTDDSRIPDLRLDEPRVVPATLAGVSIERLLSQWLPVLDLYVDQPLLLHGLGVQDALYRLSVMLLRPDEFLPAHGAAPPPVPGTKRRLVDLVCEHMMARLDQPLSITELAIDSGMSVRALQYAFLQRLGCSPMEWLTEQRLLRAQALLQGAPDLTILEVALACGFPSGSLFAQRYRQRFGHTPSQSRTRR